MSAERLAKLYDQLGFKRPTDGKNVTIEEIEITESGGHTHVKRIIRKASILPAWAKESITDFRKMLLDFHKMLGSWFQ